MAIQRRITGIGDLAEDLESQVLRKRRKGVESGVIVTPQSSMLNKIKKMNGKEKLVR